jgi:hypothetical protein
MVKIIQDAVSSAKQTTGVSKRAAARIHLFADSAEGTHVPMDKQVASDRAANVAARILKSA